MLCLLVESILPTGYNAVVGWRSLILLFSLNETDRLVSIPQNHPSVQWLKHKPALRKCSIFLPRVSANWDAPPFALDLY
jgi:hypothetical protein